MFRYRPLTLALLVALAHGGVQAESEEASALLIQQGYFWHAQEKPKRAAEAWNKVLLIDQAQPDALYGLGLIELQAGNRDQAMDYLKRLQAKQPLSRHALQLEQDIRLDEPSNKQQLHRARLLAEEDDRAGAAAAYRQALGGKPAQGRIGLEVYNNLGFVDQHWSEARSGMERLLREQPDDAYVALFLAKHLARRESTRAEGIRALARLAEREDIGGDADETWRLALTWIGPPQKAQQPLFEQFLKTHPDDAEIRGLLAKGRTQGDARVWRRDPVLDRALKALEKDDPAGAEADFQAYLAKHPKDPDALGGMGVLRQRQGRFDEAETLLNQAVAQKGGASWRSALQETRYWALLDRARDNLAGERPQQARQQLEEARRLKPEDLEVTLLLAQLQYEEDDLAAAEASYRQVLARDANNSRALTGLIRLLALQDKSDEAERLLAQLPAQEREKLGGLGSLRAEQAMQRARVAELRGDTQGMRQALEAALQADPYNVWARYSLAQLYVEAGARDEARSLMDGLLQERPNDRDTLYTSALLAVQLGDWKSAQSFLARISLPERDSEIYQLVAEVDFNLQLQQIAELSRSGRYAEARALLTRIEAQADGKPDRQAALASAYASAKDPQKGLAILRGLLERSPRADHDLTLSYAGVLLQAEQDVEVAGILRDLQGRSFTVQQRKRYDDLLFLYRVRQAEQLREKGELEAAYDTLAPALAQRPQDSLAVAALARMYAENDDPAKALELYKPLLERNPDDARLHLGAAEMAARVKAGGYAEKALERALAIAPNDVEILTGAAGVYRELGRTSKAAELLRKVVAQEQQQSEVVARAVPSAAPGNPFAGVGSRAAGGGLVPPPAAAEGYAPVALASNAIPAPASAERAPQPMVPANTLVYRDAPQANPFGVQPGRPGSVVVDSRAGLSEAARALDEIVQQRSAYVVQGLAVRSNNSESGMGKLTDVQAPLEVNFPAGENRLALRVTPVSLSAGSVSSEAKPRFGGALAQLARYVEDNPGATQADLEAAEQQLVGGSVGRQRDTGVGLAVAWERPAAGVKADLGVSPLGFLYSTAVGGISLDRPIGEGSLRYGLSASRRAVTDSLTSFAGTRDARTGQEWGGVTANGLRAQLSYDDGEIGAYGYASAHALLGENVKSNSRAELGTGVYWYLLNDDSRILTTGLSLTALGYENNQNAFTYGNGGYFSPQNYFSLAVPVRWAHRTDRWSYALRGSLGIQHFKESAVPYYPNDKAMQLSLEQAAAAAAAEDFRIRTRLDGSSETSFGYSLGGAAEYRLGRNFLLGGSLGVDNNQDYRQWSGDMYLRYMFEDMTGPMALPVSPYQSPYRN
jgi:tetratricopeptide (TPR) repeat protein